MASTTTASAAASPPSASTTRLDASSFSSPTTTSAALPMDVSNDREEGAEHPAETSQSRTPISSLEAQDVHNHPEMTEPVRVVTSLAAGALAGAIAKTAIAPLDRTKIFFQVHPERNYRIKGAVKFLRMTYNNEGFLSLWRGNSATMLRIMPNSAISYMANEQFKRLLGVGTPLGAERPKLTHFVAGSLAGMTSQGLTYPLDRGRAVMAVTPMGRYRNLWSVMKSTVKNEGWSGLYRGFSPTMAGAPIYYGCAFFTYEYLKHSCKELNARLRPEGDPPNVGKAQKAACGAAAGLIGQTSSYPLDIVRRRMQTARQMGASSSQYRSILGTLVMVYRKEGLRRGWYKGLSMNFIKGPIASSISFMCFDTFQEEFRRAVLQYKQQGHS